MIFISTLNKRSILGTLGKANEKLLVAYIQRLISIGFVPNRHEIRSLAYHFAKKLKVKHRFSEENEKAGLAWLESFLERNPELSLRQKRGVSKARIQEINWQDSKTFFDMLEEQIKENGLNGSHVFNVDECEVQLVDKKVETLKFLKTEDEEENVTIILCCSADGRFIPPTLILKEGLLNLEPPIGLPEGSSIYFGKKFSLTPELFLKWLTEQFIPNKPVGKVILLLDNHTSHWGDIETLRIAEENNIVILFLPSNMSQPVTTFVEALMENFNEEMETWTKMNPKRKLMRCQAGMLIGKAWAKVSSINNVIDGFRETGIFPLNQNVMRDLFFISDVMK